MSNGEMQIKTTIRYHLIEVRMASITNAGEGVEKREPSYTVGGNVSCTTTMENSIEVSQKSENRTTI